MRRELQEWTTSFRSKLRSVLVNRVLSPERGHLMGHLIFDGDGIFLHKQGDRMQRQSLTFHEYATPTAADVMVNAFRRYLQKAAKQSQEVKPALAQTVLNEEAYDDDIPRELLLDRYESHTKHCRICKSAYEKTKKYQVRLEKAETTLLGSAGASAVALIATRVSILAATGSHLPVLKALERSVGVCLAFSGLGLMFVQRQKAKAAAKIRKFVFEDYVHADKN